MHALALGAILAAASGCTAKDVPIEKGAPGAVFEPSGASSVHDQAGRITTSGPTRAMKGGGLAGVAGGARVKVLRAGTHEVLLPIPQLTETQIPVWYGITTSPTDAAKEYRLRQRDGSNVVIAVQLNGSRDQEIQIDWASIILITGKPAPTNATNTATYLQETACVKSGTKQVRVLAGKLWPANGKVDGYAASIQGHIRGMKQAKPPRSMDALGILASGANWICTANANLAVALLRSKQIPARSLAVIPPTAQRLEMHRVVEYCDGGRWHRFDPSSLQRDIPMKPWQGIVLATTTIADEQAAMKPRPGASLGCPYGQELELLDAGLTLWGKDFFWTQGKSLAEFDASDETADLARAGWNRFLASGKLSASQNKAAMATNAASLREAFGP